MAKFNEGDWVEVTPHPDPRSTVWNDYVHNKFCGHIGYIEEISETSDGGFIINVCVFFDEGVFGEQGNRYAWFEDKHLILSSEWEATRKVSLKREYEEYMRVEKKLKQKRDEILSEIFTPEHIKNKKQEEQKAFLEKEYDTEDDDEASYGEFNIMDLYHTKP